MKSVKNLLMFIFIVNTFYAQGNNSNFELGTAMYRELDTYFFYDNHWHTGVFNYFEYTSGYPTGFMVFSEAQGVGEETANKYVSENISASNYASNLSTLKTKLKNSFRHNSFDYYGAFSRIITPNTRSSIVATARAIGYDAVEYTWQDMLIQSGSSWSGATNDIAEIRLDGVVEYSYEKNNILVTKTYLNCIRILQYENISTPGNSSLTFHNFLHEGGYDCSPFGEICPKIQAGVDYPSYNLSMFDPLVALDPIAGDFSSTQNSNNIQLNFNVIDNASVKSYVLIQVKKTNESTWHTLIDKNNNKWEFKAVDLTDWSGSYQYDYFYIPWAGKYDGGGYASSDHNFNLKITVIDQGANHSFLDNLTFTGNIPQVEVTISGPSYLGYKEKGTYTANVSNGSGSVTYEWYKSTNGGSSWGSVIATTQTITTTMLYDDFLLRCDVHDTQTGEDDTATKSVSTGFLQKETISENEVEILPTLTKLNNNYPNPFNPTTTIKYQLKENSFVSLKVFDILGKEVADLVNGNLSAGFYETIFNASDLTSGFYIYKLTVNDFVSTKKMLLTK